MSISGLTENQKVPYGRGDSPRKGEPGTCHHAVTLTSITAAKDSIHSPVTDSLSVKWLDTDPDGPRADWWGRAGGEGGAHSRPGQGPDTDCADGCTAPRMG